MRKIISFYWFKLEILSILDSCYLTGHSHFLTMSTQRFFDQLLIYVTLYQHARHQPISLTNSGDTADEKILQSDWLIIFWPIKEEQRFSQIWDLGKNTANNRNFHYRTNSIKTNDQILHSKNLVFGPISVHFPNFGGKTNSSRKSSPVTYNFISVSSTMPKFGKN